MNKNILPSFFQRSKGFVCDLVEKEEGVLINPRQEALDAVIEHCGLPVKTTYSEPFIVDEFKGKNTYFMVSEALESGEYKILYFFTTEEEKASH